MQETGPTVYRPYISEETRIFKKAACIFSLVILRPWVLVGLGLEPETSGPHGSTALFQLS